MNKVFAGGDIKGNAVKIRGGLATVTGDEGFNMPLGKHPGKAKPEDDPGAGKPAICITNHPPDRG